MSTPTIGGSRYEPYPDEQVANSTDAAGQKFEGTVIEGFNSRLEAKLLYSNLLILGYVNTRAFWYGE